MYNIDDDTEVMAHAEYVEIAIGDILPDLPCNI